MCIGPTQRSYYDSCMVAAWKTACSHNVAHCTLRAPAFQTSRATFVSQLRVAGARIQRYFSAHVCKIVAGARIQSSRHMASLTRVGGLRRKGNPLS